MDDGDEGGKKNSEEDKIVQYRDSRTWNVGMNERRKVQKDLWDVKREKARIVLIHRRMGQRG